MAVEIAPKAKKATVTFTTPSRQDASQAILTGEWDNWEVWVMKKNKDGTFSVKVNIDLGKSYQFGYSIDGRWNIDDDRPVVASPFGTSNSVLDLTKVAPVEEEPKTEAKPAAKSSSAAKKPTAVKKTAK
jgi:1,4-alpha-glucan branching enzyme